MNYHNWTKTNKLQAPCFKTKKQIEGASGPIKHCELSACRGKNNKLKVQGVSQNNDEFFFYPLLGRARFRGRC